MSNGNGEEERFESRTESTKSENEPSPNVNPEGNTRVTDQVLTESAYAKSELRRAIATIRAIENLSTIDDNQEATDHIHEAKRHIRKVENAIHAQQINPGTVVERIAENVAITEAAIGTDPGGEGQDELAIDHDADEPSIEANDEEREVNVVERLTEDAFRVTDTVNDDESPDEATPEKDEEAFDEPVTIEADGLGFQMNNLSIKDPTELTRLARKIVELSPTVDSPDELVYYVYSTGAQTYHTNPECSSIHNHAMTNRHPIKIAHESTEITRRNSNKPLDNECSHCQRQRNKRE